MLVFRCIGERQTGARSRSRDELDSEQQVCDVSRAAGRCAGGHIPAEQAHDRCCDYSVPYFRGFRIPRAKCSHYLCVCLCIPDGAAAGPHPHPSLFPLLATLQVSCQRSWRGET